jgi:hypothetical protein
MKKCLFQFFFWIFCHLHEDYSSHMQRLQDVQGHHDSGSSGRGSQLCSGFERER